MGEAGTDQFATVRLGADCRRLWLSRHAGPRRRQGSHQLLARWRMRPWRQHHLGTSARTISP